MSATHPSGTLSMIRSEVHVRPNNNLHNSEMRDTSQFSKVTVSTTTQKKKKKRIGFNLNYTENSKYNTVHVIVCARQPVNRLKPIKPKAGLRMLPTFFFSSLQYLLKCKKRGGGGKKKKRAVKNIQISLIFPLNADRILSHGIMTIRNIGFQSE